VEFVVDKAALDRFYLSTPISTENHSTESSTLIIITIHHLGLVE
jgi:hypothetical protein